jgi:hypothetical protein
MISSEKENSVLKQEWTSKKIHVGLLGKWRVFGSVFPFPDVANRRAISTDESQITKRTFISLSSESSCGLLHLPGYFQGGDLFVLCSYDSKDCHS